MKQNKIQKFFMFFDNPDDEQLSLQELLDSGAVPTTYNSIDDIIESESAPGDVYEVQILSKGKIEVGYRRL